MHADHMGPEVKKSTVERAVAPERRTRQRVLTRQLHLVVNMANTSAGVATSEKVNRNSICPHAGV